MEVDVLSSWDLADEGLPLVVVEVGTGLELRGAGPDLENAEALDLD